jgi:hypothetical protein
MPPSVFHLELRQFPHIARAYNLSQEALHARFVGPWLQKQVLELNELQFAPERVRLKIYEGRHLRTEELGYGRGWANATRTGEDVTERELAQARGGARPSEPRGSVGALKDEIAALCDVGSITVSQALALASGARPSARVSERLAAAEQAVWELLHEGRVQLVRAAGAEPVEREDWERLLLAWGTWADSPATVLLQAAPAR